MPVKQMVDLDEEIEKVRRALWMLRENHPNQLQAIGSANCWEVLTRFGVNSAVALCAESVIEVIEADGAITEPGQFMSLLESVLTDTDLPDEYPVIPPGTKDEDGLFTHPNLYFTAVNFNGRQYGIEADASLSPRRGLNYYQDWRDTSEIIAGGSRVLSCWDAKTGRMMNLDEIEFKFHSHN